MAVWIVQFMLVHQSKIVYIANNTEACNFKHVICQLAIYVRNISSTYNCTVLTDVFVPILYDFVHSYHFRIIIHHADKWAASSVWAHWWHSCGLYGKWYYFISNIWTQFFIFQNRFSRTIYIWFYIVPTTLL